MTLLFAEQNAPFLWALSLMLIIACFEGVSMLLGAGLSALIDNLLPDIDIDTPEVDLEGAPGVLTSVLGWLFIGKIPALIWLVLFLTSFGLGGYAIQGVVESVVGAFLPTLLASVGAIAIAVLFIRLCGRVFGRLRIQDETEAVSHLSFIGMLATIVLGEARRGLAAEAKLTDRFGTTHYVRVEPEEDLDCFKAGEQVLLVRQMGSKFAAIRSENQHLNIKKS
ncbi:MAG: YqiJ family protein [Pseudomonadales bacterium]|jgi:hypothetical protein